MEHRPAKGPCRGWGEPRHDAWSSLNSLAQMCPLGSTPTRGSAGGRLTPELAFCPIEELLSGRRICPVAQAHLPLALTGGDRMRRNHVAPKGSGSRPIAESLGWSRSWVWRVI